MKHYAGIGSRETPPDVCALMTKIAAWLERRSYVLRSGGANGADAAFAANVSNAEIFLPWLGFNGHQKTTLVHPDVIKEAGAVAEKFHPAWSRCSAGAKKMHARNVFQVLGSDLKSPSRFVVCWTLDGGATGGTGQALRIASHYSVPIFNLHDSENAAKLHDYVESLK